MTKELTQNSRRSSMKMQTPFFSIVIPLWNREDCIKRCLDSIFAQDFDDYEVVVVDDCSEDNSLKIVESYSDPRLRVVCHKENRGVCAARNTGTGTAVGKWIVSLDTDWVLLPAALKFLAEMAEKAPPDVGVIGGCAKNDKGDIWPEKLPPEGPFGFIDFLKWKNSSGATDFQPCRRREVFKTIQWPTDGRLERQFHMKVAKLWKSLISREVIAMAYTDSPNRITSDNSNQGISRRLKQAPYLAKDNEEVLQNFGQDIKHYAPILYWQLLSKTAVYNFQAGRRVRGLKYAIIAILHKPWRLEMYGLILVGMIGPVFLIRVCRSTWTQLVYGWIKK